MKKTKTAISIPFLLLALILTGANCQSDLEENSAKKHLHSFINTGDVWY